MRKPRADRVEPKEVQRRDSSEAKVRQQTPRGRTDTGEAKEGHTNQKRDTGQTQERQRGDTGPT